MTVVAKIETDRVIEIGVCDELVNGMVRGRHFTIWGTNPFGSIIRIDGVGCNGRGWKKRSGIASVTVIQGPEGDEVGNIVKPMTGKEVTKVMEVRNGLISSMAVDHIVMVDTVHREQNVGVSDGGVVSRTIAELVFKEEDFAKCATKQDLGIKGFTRSCKGGESVVVGGCSVNMDDMVEKDGNVGSREGKARNGEPLERCNVDFGPNKEMGSVVRLGMVDMLDGEEQTVKGLDED